MIVHLPHLPAIGYAISLQVMLFFRGTISFYL
jgi:hypothetical protein